MALPAGLGLCCALTLLVSFEPCALGAQGVTTASVTGVVTDDSSRAIDSVSIQVINRATGFVALGSTRAGGRYLIRGLEPGGPYSVVVQRVGFRTQTRDYLTLAVGQAVRADFTLTTVVTELAPLTVEAVAGPLSRSTTGVEYRVSDSLLRRLPTLNRDLYGFVALVPQIAIRDGPSGGGVSYRFNSIQLDGASDQGIYARNAAGAVWGGKPISLEAVREYQILLSPYDVRLGNFAGALINAVTRNGTNELHGSAFFYGRSDGLAGGSASGGTRYNQSQFGFSLGGPIVHDRVHFFVAPEFQHRTAPGNGPYVGQGAFASPPVPVATADIDSFIRILEAKGIPAGSAALVETDNPFINLFGRLDVAFPGWRTRLVLRYIYSRADTNAFSRPDPLNFSCPAPACFPLSSLARSQVVTKHAATAAFYTSFPSGAGNELMLGYNTLPLRITPAVKAPLVRVAVPNAAAPGLAFLEAGAVEFAQGNLLDQAVFDVTDNYSLPVGAHRVTIGTRAQVYRLRLSQLRGSFGVWGFSSLDSLKRDTAVSYSLITDLGDADATLRGVELGLYAGDEWELTRRLSLTYGLRVDLPILMNRPTYVAAVDSFFVRRTDVVPSGRVLWSPRVGFHWDLTGAARSVIRGGLGVFAGDPPLAWLINAFANDGKGVAVLQCGLGRAGPAPMFVPDYANPPTACVGGAPPTPAVNLLDERLKFPTTLRVSVAYDRQLPWGLEATVEGLYTKNLNDFFYVNRNLAGPVGVDRFGRTRYGQIDTTGFARPNLVTTRFSPVIDLVNQSHNYSYNATVQVQKRLNGNFQFAGAFAYSRVRDVQTLLSVTALDGWQFGRALSGRQDDERVGVSGYDLPLRIVFSTTYSFPWRRWRTDVSVVYLGDAGFPFTYLANADPRFGDLNADGTNQNDPVYIPKNVYDTSEIRFDATPRADVATQQAGFDKFLSSTPCLNTQRGRIMARNSCRSPWRNTLNLSLRQSLPYRHGQALLLEVDIFNFLNLLNRHWGLLKAPNTALLAQTRQTPGLLESQPVFTFNPNFTPYAVESPYSYYQIQVAARVRF
ncbi:MAG TPA: TonB-dependent receptor [Gemmatimonadales bacterium]|nr:TonB-dependent receptor [Gemmatimonadales bacterium]